MTDHEKYTMSAYLDRRRQEQNELLAKQREAEAKELEDILKETDQIEDESLESTRKALRMVHETEDIGIGTAQKLQSQGEQLSASEKLMEKTDITAEKSAADARDVKKYSHMFGWKIRNPWSKKRKEKKSSEDVYGTKLAELSKAKKEAEAQKKGTQKNMNRLLKEREEKTAQLEKELEEEEEHEGIERGIGSEERKERDGEEDIVKEVKNEPEPRRAMKKTSSSKKYRNEKDAEIDQNLNEIEDAVDNLQVLSDDMKVELSKQAVVIEEINVRSDHVEANIADATEKIRKYT